MTKVNHFLNLNEISSGEILKILEKSHFLKNNFRKVFFPEKKTLAMIFEKPSTRTRVSFEVGMKVLNGEVMFFSPYIIHGGGINLGKEVRISFEFRFWKK